MEKKVVYFEKAGRENTAACLQIVKEAIRDFGYKHLVLASTSGECGVLFSEALKESGINLVVVTHCAGFKGPNSDEISAETRKRIAQAGAKVRRQEECGMLPAQSPEFAPGGLPGICIRASKLSLGACPCP